MLRAVNRHLVGFEGFRSIDLLGNKKQQYKVFLRDAARLNNKASLQNLQKKISILVLDYNLGQGLQRKLCSGIMETLESRFSTSTKEILS